MGYESRIIVVTKPNWEEAFIEDGKQWAKVLAIFNLGKVPELHELFVQEGKPASCYFLASGGRPVLKDKYDDDLLELDTVSFMDGIVEIYHKNQDKLPHRMVQQGTFVIGVRVFHI